MDFINSIAHVSSSNPGYVVYMIYGIPSPYVSDCMVAIASSELYYILLHKLCADSVHQALFPLPPKVSLSSRLCRQVYTKYIY